MFMRILFLIVIIQCIILHNNLSQSFESSIIHDTIFKEFFVENFKFNSDTAVNLIKRLEKNISTLYGQSSLNYAKCAYIYGRILGARYEYDESEFWYRKSLEYVLSHYGKEHIFYGTIIQRIGILLTTAASHGKSEACFLEADSILINTVGKLSPEYATNAYCKANLYLNMGHYNSAEKLYLEALDIREKIFGQNHHLFAQVLNNLGNFYSVTGNLKKAEYYLLKCKRIREETIGPNHHDYATTLYNLANLYNKLGILEKASNLYYQALDIREKRMGREHPDYATCLDKIAKIEHENGNHLKAEEQLLEVAKIRLKAFGETNHMYAHSLSSLGLFYLERNNYIKADYYLNKSKDIRENYLGKNHLDYSKSLAEIGLLHKRTGNYKMSEQYFIESSYLAYDISGPNTLNYINTLENLFSFYHEIQYLDKAEFYLLEILKQKQNLLESSSTHLTEGELLKFNTMYLKDYNNLLSLIYETNNRSQELIEMAFNSTLFHKGYVLSRMNNFYNKLDSIEDLREKSVTLDSLKNQLAEEYTKSNFAKDTVLKLENAYEEIQKELIRQAMDSTQMIKWVGYTDVQKKLKNQDLVLDFVSFNLIRAGSKTDSIIYAVLILSKDDIHPTMKFLFEHKELTILLDSLYKSVSTSKKQNFCAISEALNNLIWKPLLGNITGVNRIYLSSCGLLNKVNLQALFHLHFGTGIEEIKISQLGSIRGIFDLDVPDPKFNISNEAILFGGIEYELDTIEKLSKREEYSNRGYYNYELSDLHLGTDSTLRGKEWYYLKWTEREVDSISTMFSNTSIKPKLFKSKSATEDYFKQIGNREISPKIIHLSTHAYFFSFKQKEKAFENTVNYSNLYFDEPVFKTSSNSLIRSGVLMAGANHAWKFGRPYYKGTDDGILTAYEISMLNLSNTELVVLSACETGLGDILGNEGVFGLQRAFKLAGVKYLIMSLWQVPDKQTCILMTTFYKKLLKDKMSIPDAFHSAQQEMRDAGFELSQWAGFVLVE